MNDSEHTLQLFFLFCGSKEAKLLIGITLSFVRLSGFAFAGPTCILQNNG